jgi:predicted nuclease of predicted toxin-antitoxin system
MAESSSKLKIYTDKNVPKAVTIQLRNQGVDIIRCEDVGLGDVDDETHLAFAVSEGRMIITQDADFTRHHASWQEQGKRHAGIMYCLSHLQGNEGVGRIVSEVLMYHELIEGGAGSVEDDISNRLLFVS